MPLHLQLSQSQNSTSGNNTISSIMQDSPIERFTNWAQSFIPTEIRTISTSEHANQINAVHLANVQNAGSHPIFRFEYNDSNRSHQTQPSLLIGDRFERPSISIQQFRNIQGNIRAQNRNPTPSIHPNFRAKAVCRLGCKYCSQDICKRGMKAILLADTRVELFSTDSVQEGGNVVGYHVTDPCDVCMSSCNNG
ncbi:Protein fam72a, partial [Clydaea vesicula]